ncbi:DUF2268 domain-containing protein [Candidatus Leptofilum sp.]|uniref:DUF2268 domain-containing protein n=1 Tax=Candidatus Leptofilum sp. TaxID=3241576 RepID=UPI003B5A601C
MKSNWIPTNDYYGRLLTEPDVAKREQLYLDLFIRPWQQMMNMMQRPGMDSNDSFAGAKTWGWLLPHQTEQIAALLQKMEHANAWEIGEAAAAKAAARFAPYADRFNFDTFEGWLVLADPAFFANDPQPGYTGATDWFAPRYIGQFWEPDERNLPHLAGLVAHEMHHLVRFRVFPFNPQTTTVAEYIVLEGMAESFAAELFGEEVVGYYVTQFDDTMLDAAKSLIANGLHKTGFNVIRSYIFGDELAVQSGYEPLGGMPTYGGYAVGYHVVQAFLQRTGMSAAEATFVSADEIVAQSQFFA